KFDSVMQTSDWLSKQLADLQTKVEISQEKLVKYEREEGILGLDEKQNIITQRLDDLNKQLTTAEGDRINKEAAFQQMQKADASVVNKGEGNAALLERLMGQYNDLQVQYAQ